MIDTYCNCCINYPIAIQKGVRYAFNVPNLYLITQTKKYEHDKNIFRIKFWNTFKSVNEILLYEKKENVNDV